MKMKREGWLGEAEVMDSELKGWRKAHPEARIDEMVAQVTWRRRRLMGQLVEELVGEGQVEEPEPSYCPECGGVLEFRGKNKRCISHYEGETELERAYYYCPRCQRGLFPPG